MLTQLANITLFNLQNIPSRAGSSCMIVIGTAGVVGVFVGLFALGIALESAMTSAASPDRGLVLRDGTNREEMSFLSGPTVGIVEALDEIAMAAGETIFRLKLLHRPSSEERNVLLRGVDPVGLTIRPELKITKGRMFSPGTKEIIVGESLLREFAGLHIGEEIKVLNGQLKVVGHFATGGSIAESELLMDLITAQDSYRYGRTVSLVRVTLHDGATVTSLNETLKTLVGMPLSYTSEPDLFAMTAQKRIEVIRAFANWVIGIMLVGAFVAGLSTMYSAINARRVEIATLRSLGFSNLPIVVSVLAEAMLLALLGAVIGVAVIYIGFDGAQATTADRTTGIAFTFGFRLDATAIGVGVGSGLLLGLVSGLVASMKVVRAGITDGLRQ